MESAQPAPADELATLRQMLAERDAELATACAKLSRAAIEQLRIQFATLRRARFGQSSEKLDQAIDQLELRLDDLEENEAEQIAVQPARQKAEARSRLPALRKPLPAHLPREIVVHKREITCDYADRRLGRMGEDVTEVLEWIPAKQKVVRHVRPKYACRCCERIFQAGSTGPADRGGPPRPGADRQRRGLEVWRRPTTLSTVGDPGAGGHRSRSGHCCGLGRPCRLVAGAVGPG